MKKIKILFIFITIIIIMALLPIRCQAAGVLEGLGENLDEYGKMQGEESYDNFLSKIGVFLSLLQMIGSVVSVVCLIVIGIKYIMGSVEEKAEYKKTLMPYLIGAVLIFATTNILSIVYKIAVKIA